MYPELETMAKRLEWSRKQKGLSQADLGAKLCVSQGAIEKAENGKTRKPKFLPEAAHVLGVPYSWLSLGKVGEQPENTYQQKAPVYGFASGSNDKMMLNDGAIIDHQPRHNPNMGNDGFYMIVVGDSMEPRYEQGEKIAVSKSLPPRKGRDVVIEFIDGSAAVKKLKEKTSREIICQQLNPKKEIKYNTNEVLNIYAVVGHEF